MKNLFVIAFSIIFIALLIIVGNWEIQRQNIVSRKYIKDVPINSQKTELGNKISQKPKTGSENDFLVNVQNKPNHYIVTINTLGIDVSDVDVKVEGRQLDILIKISNSDIQNTNLKNSDYKYLSRYMGEFSKSITLPGPVVTDKISSDFKDGVLTVTLLKQ